MTCLKSNELSKPAGQGHDCATLFARFLFPFVIEVKIRSTALWARARLLIVKRLPCGFAFP